MRVFALLILFSCATVGFAQHGNPQLEIPSRYQHIDSIAFIYRHANETQSGKVYHICFLINPTEDTLSYFGRHSRDTFWKTKYLRAGNWEESDYLGNCYVGTKKYDIPPNHAAAIRIYETDFEAGTLQFGMEFFKKGKYREKQTRWTQAVVVE